MNRIKLIFLCALLVIITIFSGCFIKSENIIKKEPIIGTWEDTDSSITYYFYENNSVKVETKNPCDIYNRLNIPYSAYPNKCISFSFIDGNWSSQDYEKYKITIIGNKTIETTPSMVMGKIITYTYYNISTSNFYYLEYDNATDTLVDTLSNSRWQRIKS